MSNEMNIGNTQISSLRGIQKVYFIGIGGISMSGLAAVMLNSGYKVSGSDFKNSPIVEKLESSGAEVYIGHKRENIKDVDLVVYTAAIPSDNPELLEAKEKNITLEKLYKEIYKLNKLQGLTKIG